MKRLLASVGALALTAGGALAADDVTLQLKWVTQAQFAGYYVAKDKGFYEEEGLDVMIKPGGPDIAPEQVIAGGGADVITTWMAAGLAAFMAYAVALDRRHVTEPREGEAPATASFGRSGGAALVMASANADWAKASGILATRGRARPGSPCAPRTSPSARRATRPRCRRGSSA